MFIVQFFNITILNNCKLWHFLTLNKQNDKTAANISYSPLPANRQPDNKSVVKHGRHFCFVNNASRRSNHFLHMLYTFDKYMSPGCVLEKSCRNAGATTAHTIMPLMYRGGGAKKIVGAEGSEGETRIWVKGGVLLGANPRKSCNRLLKNYNAEFGLKQHLICGAKRAYVYIFIFHLLD